MAKIRHAYTAGCDCEKCAATPKFYKWTVEFQVAATWVQDGFDLDDARALEMLANDLRFANGAELKARVVKAPLRALIRAEQGHVAAVKGEGA
jgi:hypothetical protein